MTAPPGGPATYEMLAPNPALNPPAVKKDVYLPDKSLFRRDQRSILLISARSKSFEEEFSTPASITCNDPVT